MIDFQINAVAQINHSKKWFAFAIALFFIYQVALGQKANVPQKQKISYKTYDIKSCIFAAIILQCQTLYNPHNIKKSL